ncbi:MAG: WXG100 family type VII secretion target [Clostridiales bacterium]|nr:WXG100 family type VII secretion target [Clostridiales bacterium]
MALIQVTPDLLNAKATELRGIKDEHDQTMVRMRNLILSLNEIWKGDAQDAFVAKYESMQSTFTAFSQMLEQYAVLMNTSAAKMQETDQSLQGTMNSFGG